MAGFHLKLISGFVSAGSVFKMVDFVGQENDIVLDLRPVDGDIHSGRLLFRLTALDQEKGNLSMFG